MAVPIEISCDSLQEIAEDISISLLQSTLVQSIATSCKVENAPVNRRVVGSSPTSGANIIKHLQPPLLNFTKLHQIAFGP
jgi:hypothetical protein